MPIVRGYHRTPRKPAVSMRRASSGSLGKLRHGPREIPVRRRLSAHQAADRGQHMVEVRVIERPHDRTPRPRELQDDESRPRRQDPIRLGQPRVEIGHIADAERDDGAAHRRVGERELQRVRGDGRDGGPRRLASPARSMGSAKSAPITVPAKPRLAGQLGRHVEGASAEIEIRTIGVPLPPELPDGNPAPRAIDVRAEQMVEQIVARRDLGENPAHVSALLRPACRRRIGDAVPPIPVRPRGKTHPASDPRQADGPRLA